MAKKIFCIGDSITAGNQPVDTYPNGLQNLLDYRAPGQYAVSNHGLPGEASGSTIYRFGTLLNNLRPDTIIVGIGANDMFLGVSDETLKTHLVMMCTAARNYNTKLLILGMPNWKGGRQFDEDHPVYAQVGREQGIPVQGGGYRACLTNPAYWHDTVHLRPGANGYLAYSFHVLDALINSRYV